MPNVFAASACFNSLGTAKLTEAWSDSTINYICMCNLCLLTIFACSYCLNNWIILCNTQKVSPSAHPHVCKGVIMIWALLQNEVVFWKLVKNSVGGSKSIEFAESQSAIIWRRRHRDFASIIELSFNLIGLFGGSWSLMFSHWLFSIYTRSISVLHLWCILGGNVWIWIKRNLFRLNEGQSHFITS